MTDEFNHFDTDTHWYINGPNSNIGPLEWGKLYPNFLASELASGPDNKILIVLKDAMDALQCIRNKLNMPLFINSAYRTPEHNSNVGGSPTSQHVKGRAFDIGLTNYSSRLSKMQMYGDAIEDAATEAGFNGIGRYNTFIHIDMRKGEGSYYWDERDIDYE